MRMIKAPQCFRPPKSVFLAGSIEQGRACDWQQELAQFFAHTDYTLLNPRRDDWNSNWEQSSLNREFAEQVNWELDALDHCDKIAMYFDPATQSPISLLELGLYATSGKLFVCCPQGYWRKGNVDIVCRRHKVPLCDDLAALAKAIMWSDVKFL